VKTVSGRIRCEMSKKLPGGAALAGRKDYF